ncbi:uncharacterized protein LOC119588207 [Penaeus monodon]|uniref:uncharacterized protein LOC119588207 n=1 Tax=Penaeus monodon TaxID=6687 RepID=UPI0018A6F521|nr:uncharacterized protein LOC119588207 [Penaeus monodon]
MMWGTAGGAVMLLVVLSSRQAEGVRVFNLQRGLWTVPANDVFLRYNFSKSTRPVNELTACYRVKFESFVLTNLHLSYASSQQKPNALAFFGKKVSLQTTCNSKSVA